MIEFFTVQIEKALLVSILQRGSMAPLSLFSKKKNACQSKVLRKGSKKRQTGFICWCLDDQISNKSILHISMDAYVLLLLLWLTNSWSVFHWWTRDNKKIYVDLISKRSSLLIYFITDYMYFDVCFHFFYFFQIHFLFTYKVTPSSFF